MKNKIFEQEKTWILREKYGVENESDLKGGKIGDFSTDIKRLTSGEPLAYIIGTMPFLNCIINLEKKPLIPRHETEFWVQDFIQNELREKQEKTKILDIFSGSGCIGISLLKNCSDISIDFAEINPGFIQQIKKNLEMNILPFENTKNKNTTWEIYQSDVFDSLLKEKIYDYILANPPYIPLGKRLSSSVLDHEDHNSLFAKDNGLFFVKKTITEGLPKLQRNGKIYIEFDETSKEDIENFLKEKNLKKFEFKKDQFNNWRVLVIWN